MPFHFRTDLASINIGVALSNTGWFKVASVGGQISACGSRTTKNAAAGQRLGQPDLIHEAQICVCL